MQDIVKFLFGISGECIAASSILGCLFGDDHVGLVNLHVFGWFACFRKCHCSLSLLIPGVSTDAEAPSIFDSVFVTIVRDSTKSIPKPCTVLWISAW
jgi:hypothetical protein